MTRQDTVAVGEERFQADERQVCSARELAGKKPWLRRRRGGVGKAKQSKARQLEGYRMLDRC